MIAHCVICGADISQRQSTAKFCSKACKRAYHKPRQVAQSRNYMRHKRASDPEFKERQRIAAQEYRKNNPGKSRASATNARAKANPYKATKYQQHVLDRNRFEKKRHQKHDAHVQCLNSVASIETQQPRYDASGEPWRNPKLSDADRYRIRYNNDMAFRLKEINRQTHRKNVLRSRDDGTQNFWALLKERKSCPYCGIPITRENAVADHMDPLKLGGENGNHNLTICCKSCNKKKAARPYLEWVEMLPRERRNAAMAWYKKKHGASAQARARQAMIVMTFS